MKNIKPKTNVSHNNYFSTKVINKNKADVVELFCCHTQNANQTNRCRRGTGTYVLEIQAKYIVICSYKKKSITQMCILGVRDKLTLLTKTTSTTFPRLILAASKKTS